MAKPIYYLTFLGQAADRGEYDNGLPEGEEIFDFLRSSIPQLGVEVLEADSSVHAYFLWIRRGEMRYLIDFTQPFKTFDRMEWLIITEPKPTLYQRFWTKAERRPEIIHQGIQTLLEGIGRFHTFKTYISGVQGGEDWSTYPA
jgi:hypothetical protein